MTNLNETQELSAGGRVVVADLHGTNVAFLVDAVVEYVDALDVTPVLGLKPQIRGFVDYRSEAVPAVDALELISSPDSSHSAEYERNLIVDYAPGRRCSIGVSYVREIVEFDSVTPASPEHANAGISGQIEYSGAQVPLVDYASLFRIAG